MHIYEGLKSIILFSDYDFIIMLHSIDFYLFISSQNAYEGTHVNYEVPEDTYHE